MVLDIIICVGLGVLVFYLVYSIVKKVKAKKKAKQEKDNEPIIVEPLENDDEKKDN